MWKKVKIFTIIGSQSMWRFNMNLVSTAVLSLGLTLFAAQAFAFEFQQSSSGTPSYSSPSEPTKFGEKTPRDGGLKQGFNGNPKEKGDVRSKAQKIAEFQASRALKRQAFEAKAAEWYALRQARSLPGVSSGLRVTRPSSSVGTRAIQNYGKYDYGAGPKEGGNLDGGLKSSYSSQY